MKLNKKQEAEILQVYIEYWDAHSKGDLKPFASVRDSDCRIIDSAAGEPFKSFYVVRLKINYK